MIFFVALAEELFRVILQPQLIERSSAVVGIPITSAIFGAMHAGYANGYELLFATVAGVVLGVAFYKNEKSRVSRDGPRREQHRPLWRARLLYALTRVALKERAFGLRRFGLS